VIAIVTDSVVRSAPPPGRSCLYTESAGTSRRRPNTILSSPSARWREPSGARGCRFRPALGSDGSGQPRGGVGCRSLFGLGCRFFGQARLALRPAARDRVSHTGGEEADGAQRVVVPGDDVVNLVWVGVRIDDADDRNLQLPSLIDRDLLLARIDDEHRVGQPRHHPDAFQVLEELALLLLGPGDLLLGQRFVPSVGDHGLQVAETRQAALDGREVGQQAAEPTLVHEIHPAPLRFLGDHVLRLALGTHEEHRATVGRQIRDELFGRAEALRRLVQVDDVDAVPLPEDEWLHLWVPALGLVAEVHPRFE
jgi:hypothetical protein